MKPVIASKPDFVSKSVSPSPASRSHALALSDRVYRKLLVAYPAEFRRRYGPEMAQVFRTSCRASYHASGARGVLRLWLPTLWDWVWTAGREWFSALFRRSTMNDTLSFDHQAGDMVWSMMTGLFAGYSLPQVIKAISIQAPEPTASAFKRLHADLTSGLSLEQGLANMLEAVPSRHLAQVIAVIQEQRKTGGNLAWLLEPLVDEILQQVPSDGSFYPAMRQEAKDLGAQVPDRAQEK
jgi:hypothetical protein